MLIYNTTNPGVKNGLFNRIRLALPTLAGYGVGGLLLPPITQTAEGANSQSIGYDKRYDLNVGQFPGDPLRWGTATDLIGLTFAASRVGIIVLEDNVVHQYGGAANQTYFEKGEDGSLDRSLIPKYSSCFVNATHAQDQVFDPAGDAPFGDEVTFQHCKPEGYMQEVLIQATVWRWRQLGLGGMRGDDFKGIPTSVAKALCSAATVRDGWNFCEVFVGYIPELVEYIRLTGIRVLDFPFHWAVQHLCDDGWPLSSIKGASLWEYDSDHSVPFVDTYDTDRSNNENVKFNKLWAYCLLTTVPCGGALIYSGDYEGYGLSELINNLMWIGTTFAIGNHRWEFADDTLLVWSRDGNGGKLGWSGGLLCAFSSDPINPRSEWVHTPFAPNTHLHDYAGHGFDLWTNRDGWVELTVGPNVNGSAQNYVCYAPAGVTQAVPIKPIQHLALGNFTDFSSITAKYQ